MKVVKMNDKRIAFVVAARNLFGESKSTINRPEIYAVLEENEGMTFPQWVVGQQFRTQYRGMYHLPLENGRFDMIDPVVSNAASVDAGEHNHQQSAVAMAPRAIEVLEEQESYVPEKFEGVNQVTTHPCKSDVPVS